jgi:hypothetical protein
VWNVAIYGEATNPMTVFLETWGLWWLVATVVALRWFHVVSRMGATVDVQIDAQARELGRVCILRDGFDDWQGRRTPGGKVPVFAGEPEPMI